MSGCSSGVEHNLAKVGVERSNRFTRSNSLPRSVSIFLPQTDRAWPLRTHPFSAFREHVLRFLPKHVAGPQYPLRKIRMVDGVRPDLRFETEARKRAVVAAAKSRNRNVQLETRVELDPGFRGPYLQRDA